jgi:hypothetical protein
MDNNSDNDEPLDHLGRGPYDIVSNDVRKLLCDSIESGRLTRQQCVLIYNVNYKTICRIYNSYIEFDD